MPPTYFELSISTSKRNEFLDITHEVSRAVAESGVAEGLCVVHIPHTTAGVTINENADPDVVRDMEIHLSSMVPPRGDFRHSEGNSDSHIKSTLAGPSLTVIIHGGRLVLGTWQGIYFCEFDGPRRRRFMIKCMEG
ncbi:MAG: hypothetical protein A2Y33_02025 [Spirochaetes bacterium GWF1_51_8]|nr:MAG: hypothetical protein A2Y33_02025 [Spirochaetes bacterium GWF1_51_8]